MRDAQLRDLPLAAVEEPGTQAQAAPQDVLRSTICLLAGLSTLVMANGLLSTLAALQMVHAKFQPMMLGVVQSAYYAGFMVGAWRSSALISRLGHRRTFAAFTTVAGGVALGYAIAVKPESWALARFMTGLCVAGVFTVMESWLNGAVRNAWRARIMAVYLIITYLCVGAGQFLIRAANPYGSALFLLSGALFAASVVPVMLARDRTGGSAMHPTSAAARSGLDGVYTALRFAPLGLGGCFIAGSLNSVFYSLYPVYMRTAGYPVETVSHFMGTALIAALLPQWPVACISDRFERRWVMLAMAALLGTSGMILLLLPDDGTIRSVAYLYVSVIFTFYGLSVAYTNDRTPPAARITTSAGLLLTFAFGGITGPVATSLVITWTGPSGIYLFTAAAAAVLAVLALASRGNGSPSVS